jgi:hypothetical protein
MIKRGLTLYLASFIPLMVAAEQGSSEPPLFFILSMLLMLVPFALMGLWVLGGVWGAVRTLQGREFSYVLIGNRLKHRLASQ